MRSCNAAVASGLDTAGGLVATAPPAVATRVPARPVTRLRSKIRTPAASAARASPSA